MNEDEGEKIERDTDRWEACEWRQERDVSLETELDPRCDSAKGNMAAKCKSLYCTEGSSGLDLQVKKLQSG